MYPVSLEYQNKIKENVRTFKAEIEIQHSTGVLNLEDKDLALGTLIYKESSQSGEEFTIGSTVASDINFTIINKPEYADINFEGATVIPTISLLLDETTDRWEGVPLGRFNIDEPLKQRNIIQIKAIDNMVELDKPYSLSNLSYPANLYQIYVNICNVADVQVGTANFPNKDYVVIERPDDELTLRDVLGYVAELTGCFAKINRTGALELLWYKSSGLELTPANRFNFKAKDYTVQIKGVMATIGNIIYLAGTEDYAIDLTDNPLLQGDYETVLPNIYNNVKDTIFTPYESSWQGNPAIQAGDMITQEDRDGNIYNTLVTSSIYKYRGSSTLTARGLPEIAKGYKGSTNKKIANIVRRVVKPIGDQLTTLEQAQLEATELLANMLGGYIIKDEENGILYIADNPDIEQAMKVWKYGINGFGYSSTGVDGTYTTSVTADGSIVAMLVAANIITADMVQTGLLSSEDGSTWINLDDGTYNLKDKIKFVNDEFSIDLDSEDLQGLLSISGVNLVSNLPNNWENGGFDNLGQVINKNNYMRTIDYYPHDSGNMVISFLKDYGYEVTIYLYDRDFVNYDILTIANEDAIGRFENLNVGFFKVEVTKTGLTWGDLLNWTWGEVREKKWAYFTKKPIIETLKLKVENGNIATTWTPSPYDTEENYVGKINEAKAEIKVTTDEIKSSVTDIEQTIDLELATKSEVSQTADSIVLNFSELQDMYGQDIAIESGNIKFSKDGMVVTHSDYPGQSSTVDARGFFKQYEHGEGAYLNDIYTATDIAGESTYDSVPQPVTITLPSRFRGRNAEILFIPRDWRTGQIGMQYSSGVIGTSPKMIRSVGEVVSSNFNLENPTISISSYLEITILDYYPSTGTLNEGIRYRKITFDLIVIGK